MHERRQSVHVGALELAQLAVQKDLRGQWVGRELFHDRCIRAETGLGLLEALDAQLFVNGELVEQDRLELLG